MTKKDLIQTGIYQMPVYSQYTLETHADLSEFASGDLLAVRKGRPKKIRIETVVKSDGRVQKFDWRKIEKSVITAGRDTREYSKKDAQKILSRVKSVLGDLDRTELKTLHIRSVVEPIMADEGYFKTARYYILYKERRDQERKKQFTITEPIVSSIGKEIAEKRYVRTDEKGIPIETVGQMFWRVATHMAKAEINWGDESVVADMSERFFERMVNWKFVCSGKAMFEAGNPGGTGQLSACFVLPIEDSIGSIFKTLGDGAVVHKNNGGTGYNFSKIRPHGDKVKNVPGAASGPVDFLKAFSAALSKILQGAKRQGANIAVLNVDHPDIMDFVNLKDEDGTIKNFNISVGVTNKFMEAVAKGESWDLINPRNGEVHQTVKAKDLFDAIAEHAWISGDPGLAFLDRMEEDNPTPFIGKIDATNPCGEIPLLPYESCNLTSICLQNHLFPKDGGYEIDWNDLEKSVRLAVRFLDDMIEVNTYPLKEIEEMVKLGNRRIGVGVMGLGHLLYMLKIPYGSKEAVLLSKRLAKFIHKTAESESIELAKVRGVFPNFDRSIYAGTAERYRNCALTMVAPTGTIGLLADSSSGIEPVFSLVTLRKAFNEDDSSNRPTREFMMVDPIFEETLESIDLSKVKNAATGKSIKTKDEFLLTVFEQGLGSIKGLPAWVYKVFQTTHEIDPDWHVKIQAAWQSWFDNSISKTINFPHDATVDDVKRSYIQAWKLGCKGITIYRDGSKGDQVLNTGKTKKVSKDAVKESKVDFTTSICPECNGKVVFESGCVVCKDCGWSECRI